MTKQLVLLGSTGSIGTQSLDVVRAYPDLFSVCGLACGNNIDLLATQIREFSPKVVCVGSQNLVKPLRTLVPEFDGDIFHGSEGLNTLAADSSYETLLVGLVGLVGLEPTLEALKAGKQVLTANKETFVAGGHLVAPYLKQIIPVDSEHSALHQCLANAEVASVETIYLTASGGPFRTRTRAEMEKVTVKEALKHPNWEMGAKITIDSATMMNKGLEVIEARWLFGLGYDRIRVVVHPQSIIHGAVVFRDGSIIAQLGAADMRVPIQYALTYPERLTANYPGARLDLLSLSRLDLEPPDLERFPCIRLAYEAGRAGSAATAVLNAADEAAVDLFLQGRIGFLQIPALIEKALEEYTSLGFSSTPTLAEIKELDQWARQRLNERNLLPC